MDGSKYVRETWRATRVAECSLELTELILRFGDGDVTEEEEDGIIALMSEDRVFAERVDKTLRADLAFELCLGQGADSARRFNAGLVVLCASTRHTHTAVTPSRIPDGVRSVALSSASGDAEDSRGVELVYPHGTRVSVSASSEGRSIRVSVRGLLPAAPAPFVALASKDDPSRSGVVQAEPAGEGDGYSACFRDLAPGDYQVMLPPIGEVDDGGRQAPEA